MISVSIGQCISLVKEREETDFALETAKRMVSFKNWTFSRLRFSLLDADTGIDDMQELASLIRAGKASVDLSNSLANRYMNRADFAYYGVSRSPFSRNNGVDSVRKYLRIKKRRD